MSFKKQLWEKYGKNGRFCVLQIMNSSGELEDRKTWNLIDKKKEKNIFFELQNKWGIFSPKSKV